jgi:hypothetical protein
MNMTEKKKMIRNPMNEGFNGDWFWFDFDGESEPSKIYSLMYVQDGAIFDGSENTAKASLHHSLEFNYFLVELGKQQWIWDISELFFSLLLSFENYLRVYRGNKFLLI